MCEESASADVSRYSWAKQIAVDALLRGTGNAQHRTRTRSQAGATDVRCDTKVAIEIERALSIKTAETVARVAQIGISTKDCHPVFILDARHSGSKLGHDYQRGKQHDQHQHCRFAHSLTPWEAGNQKVRCAVKPKRNRGARIFMEERA